MFGITLIFFPHLTGECTGELAEQLIELFNNLRRGMICVELQQDSRAIKFAERKMVGVVIISLSYTSFDIHSCKILKQK